MGFDANIFSADLQIRRAKKGSSNIENGFLKKAGLTGVFPRKVWGDGVLKVRLGKNRALAKFPYLDFRPLNNRIT